MALPVEATRAGDCHWAQPLSAAAHAAAAAAAAAGKDCTGGDVQPLTAVLERLVCQATAHARLAQAALSARLLLQQMAAQEGEQGPRSISQVHFFLVVLPCATLPRPLFSLDGAETLSLTAPTLLLSTHS